MTEEELNSSQALAAESELVQRAQRSDPLAWAEIYSAHSNFVYRYIRARVFDADAAEDLMSAVFLKALQSIRSYRYRGRPLLAWLYGIARNVVADHHRKARTRESYFDRLMHGMSKNGDAEFGAAPLFELGGRRDDPAAGIERLDLQAAVNALPEAQREVVILRHFAGLSTPQIAVAIGKKATAVYSLEARALINLRRSLSDVEKSFEGADEKEAPSAINKQMESTDSE
jgi:RNA polymerase sigma-70 factor, ECF subfamily